MTSNKKQLEFALRIFERRYDRLVRLRYQFRADLNETGMDLMDAGIHATALDVADMKAAIASESRR